MQIALTGADIFDGATRYRDHALLIKNARIAGIVPPGHLPADAERVSLDGGLLAPGFVDIQVNGGGGVMLNDSPDVATMAKIAATHLPFGTTSLLPTLITDTPSQVAAAIAAAQNCTAPGVAGLHLEGPHLSKARKGAHNPALIHEMDDFELAVLCAAAGSIRSLYLTVAPESVPPSQIRRLVDAGAIVSLGHTDCDYATARAAFDAGANVATHLFNAMSQLTSRTPGLVGAVLDDGRIWAGLIADGVHVHPAVLRAALAAKAGPAKLFLVTDAMAPIGTNMTSFTLNDREIRREHGRLTLADGTLAGADLDMISAVRFVVNELGQSAEEALRMAATYPAQMLGRSDEIGTLRPGAQADVLWLGATLNIKKIWRGGVAIG